jgi:hypothetical protein
MPKGGSTRAKADVKNIDKEVASLQSSRFLNKEDPLLPTAGGKYIRKKMDSLSLKGENLARKVQGKETRAELLARREKAQSASDQSDELKRKVTTKRFMNGGCVMAGRGVKNTKMG